MENLILEHLWYLTMKLYPLHSTPSNPCIVTQLTWHIPLAVLFLKYIDICKGIWMHLHRKSINTVFYSISLQLLGNCKNIFTYARITRLSIKRTVVFFFFPQRDAQSKKEQWSIKLESSYQIHSECCVLFQTWRRKAFQRQLQTSLSFRGSNNCDLRALPIKAIGACCNDDIQEKRQETSNLQILFWHSHLSGIAQAGT